MVKRAVHIAVMETKMKKINLQSFGYQEMKNDKDGLLPFHVTIYHMKMALFLVSGIGLNVIQLLKIMENYVLSILFHYFREFHQVGYHPL